MPPAAATVLEQAIEGERALKDALHQLVIVDKLLPVKWLASAAGYTESSTYKSLDRDAVNCLAVRILDAAALGSPAIASRIIRALVERWQPVDPIAEARPSLPETLRELAEAGAAQARSHNEAITRLADGAVSVEDLTALERLWAHEDQEREEFRDKLRAMCTDRIYGLKTFGKVAG